MLWTTKPPVGSEVSNAKSKPNGRSLLGLGFEIHYVYTVGFFVYLQNLHIVLDRCRSADD